MTRADCTKSLESKALTINVFVASVVALPLRLHCVPNIPPILIKVLDLVGHVDLDEVDASVGSVWDRVVPGQDRGLVNHCCRLGMGSAERDSTSLRFGSHCWCVELWDRGWGVGIVQGLAGSDGLGVGVDLCRLAVLRAVFVAHFDFCWLS